LENSESEIINFLKCIEIMVEEDKYRITNPMISSKRAKNSSS
jgi:hypothetical protein